MEVEDRLAIGKYACAHTIKEVVDRFISKHSSLTRQTVRIFKAIYIEHTKRVQDLVEVEPGLDVT